MYHTTPVVNRLLLLNIAIFLVQNFLGIDLINALGLRNVLSDHFQPYQFFSHLFVHASFTHLFGNMVSLLTFGPILEQTLRARKFISFYLITGLGAAVLYTGIQYVTISKLQALYYAYLAHPTPATFAAYLHNFPSNTYNTYHTFISAFLKHPDNLAYIDKSKAIIYQLYTCKADIPIVGASGSIFGIFMAFAMLFPNTELLLFRLPFPIKAKYVIVIYSIYELAEGIRDNPADHIAHFAHLGGILSAYIFVKWLQWRHH